MTTAGEWLELVRQCATKGSVASYIQDEIRGANLKEIGTSEEELESLRKQGEKNEALKWLRLSREAASLSSVSSHVEYLREFTIKAGLELGDMGTSEKELQDLLHQGYISEAKKWLQFFRDRRGPAKYIREYIREFCAKANITLESLGTNEEELRRG